MSFIQLRNGFIEPAQNEPAQDKQDNPVQDEKDEPMQVEPEQDEPMEVDPMEFVETEYEPPKEVEQEICVSSPSIADVNDSSLVLQKGPTEEVIPEAEDKSDLNTSMCSEENIQKSQCLSQLKDEVSQGIIKPSLVAYLNPEDMKVHVYTHSKSSRINPLHTIDIPNIETASSVNADSKINAYRNIFLNALMNQARTMIDALFELDENDHRTMVIGVLKAMCNLVTKSGRSVLFDQGMVEMFKYGRNVNFMNVFEEFLGKRKDSKCFKQSYQSSVLCLCRTCLLKEIILEKHVSDKAETRKFSKYSFELIQEDFKM